MKINHEDFVGNSTFNIDNDSNAFLGNLSYENYANLTSSNKLRKRSNPFRH